MIICIGSLVSQGLLIYIQASPFYLLYSSLHVCASFGQEPPGSGHAQELTESVTLYFPFVPVSNVAVGAIMLTGIEVFGLRYGLCMSEACG